MSLRLAVVAEGDANSADCWSGSGQRFVASLREAGVHVDVYDAELRSWAKRVVAAVTYHPTRSRWRQRYGLGAVPHAVRSAQVSRALRRSAIAYDAIIQIGATFLIDPEVRRGAHYIVYCDSNLAHARKAGAYAAAGKLTPQEVRHALNREQRVYDVADRIWTMSQALADSFRADFSQSPEKLCVIYSGANNVPSPLAAETTAPRILFIGRDHARKGSDVLLAAFKQVRAQIPSAELHFVGGTPAGATAPGVVSHGVLSRANAAHRETLDRLFASSTVFCLPSRYEPFGIAFVEAMLAGLPCIGTQKWAMPEIIADGETGWLVPDGSVSELARVLVHALQNPELCRSMGARGRERALGQFTWDLVAARALTDLERLLAASRVR
jgi:alpha-maltose-1-phosphate synthase